MKDELLLKKIMILGLDAVGPRMHWSTSADPKFSNGLIIRPLGHEIHLDSSFFQPSLLGGCFAKTIVLKFFKFDFGFIIYACLYLFSLHWY
jgi:hypothetical protein